MASEGVFWIGAGEPKTRPKVRSDQLKAMKGRADRPWYGGGGMQRGGEEGYGEEEVRAWAGRASILRAAKPSQTWSDCPVGRSPQWRGAGGPGRVLLKKAGRSSAAQELDQHPGTTEARGHLGMVSVPCFQMWRPGGKGCSLACSIGDPGRREGGQENR